MSESQGLRDLIALQDDGSVIRLLKAEALDIACRLDRLGRQRDSARRWACSWKREAREHRRVWHNWMKIAGEFRCRAERAEAERDAALEQARQKDVVIRVDEEIGEKFGQERDSARRWARAWKAGWRHDRDEAERVIATLLECCEKLSTQRKSAEADIAALKADLAEYEAIVPEMRRCIRESNEAEPKLVAVGERLLAERNALREEVERLKAVAEAARKVAAGIAVGTDRNGAVSGTRMTPDFPARLYRLGDALESLDADRE